MYAVGSAAAVVADTESGKRQEAIGGNERAFGEAAVKEPEAFTQVLGTLPTVPTDSTGLVRAEQHAMAGRDAVVPVRGSRRRHLVADRADGAGDVEPRNERQFVVFDHCRIPLDDPEVVAVDRTRLDLDDRFVRPRFRVVPRLDVDRFRTVESGEGCNAHTAPETERVVGFFERGGDRPAPDSIPSGG